MWEPVIGLEIHVQLATASKLFSGAAARFGAQPNEHACAIDLGMPGVLPVVNQRAVDMALTFGVAIGADIPRQSIFARKHYFYPDLPKGYQISQYEHPIIGKGQLSIRIDDTTKIIGITRAHLEEDAGKSIHTLRPHQSAIDLNRAGTPLLEIVSEPELSSSHEAVAYYKAIHQLVTYLKICDGELSQGSMRCDANVSVRPHGSKQLGTRTEIKNINSFRFIKLAIDYEIERHIQLLEQGADIHQETRLFDPNTHTTRTMRSKEEAHDYRYFPDPDIPALLISTKQLNRIRAELPELPHEKFQRFTKEYGLNEQDTWILTQSQALANYFEKTLSYAQRITQACSAKLCANWIITDLMGLANQHQMESHQIPIEAKHLGKLIARIADNTLSSKMAKTLLHTLWNAPQDPDDLIAANNINQITDTEELATLVRQIIEQHPKQTEQYHNSVAEKRKKLIGFFVGHVMKTTSGKADPKLVNQLLKQHLQAEM